MRKIVLLRHGESAWNKENRFTGWTDVDLTEKGIAEAEKAGETLKEYGFNFDKAYTSYLKRAVKTLNCVLDKMDLDWIPVEKNWRLNEKHYGDLQGLNKAETAGILKLFLSTPSARRATAKTETKSLFSYKLYNILHEFRRALIYNGSKNYPNHAK